MATSTLIDPELFHAREFVNGAIEQLAAAGSEDRGAVFTKREVVGFILDLVRYNPSEPLWERSILEPSCGHGDFLTMIVERLLESWKRAGRTDGVELSDAIRAVELHTGSLLKTRALLDDQLKSAGLASSERKHLLDCWLTQGDFLLEDFESKFDFIVGNPPYLRQEMIPDVLLAEYRRRFTTMYDRADLYVAFIERSLRLLKPKGALGFICADRWMKNRYGGPLREMVAGSFRLQFYIDMVGTEAFHSDVIAYPAITVITREAGGTTRIAHQPEISLEALSKLASELLSDGPVESDTASELCNVTNGSEPWLLDKNTPVMLNLVRRLESRFPNIEDAGCRVGIGVATGADKLFIGPMNDLDVEDSRKLPLAMTRDILSGSVDWRGLGVINPFEADGSLAAFENYPRFGAYMERHGSALRERHCAQKNVNGWYRTIDRITPSLAATPKLLIPDIKGAAHVVYEEGRLYPHHNLYYIVSDEWNLHALRAVLLSSIATLFVEVYATKMHGGFLRFQAQYLRRIRLPKWDSIDLLLRDQLVERAEHGNLESCRDLVYRIYEMSPEEIKLMTPKRD